MENQVLRQLKLKSDALKRLGKERDYYAKEIENDRARVDKYKADQMEYEAKKAAEVLDESIAAKQAVDQKFNTYYEDLKTMLQETESQYHDHEEVEAARKALQQSVQDSS